MVNQPFFHGDIPNFRCLSPNMCHCQNLCFFFCSGFVVFSGGHQSITKSLASAGLDHGTYENSDCSPWGVSINVVTSKCLVFISWKIPSRNERGTPTSETSISSIDHPNSRFTCTPMVPVISGFILYIVSGRYLVGGAMCPSWKIWKSMGRMTSHIWNGT